MPDRFLTLSVKDRNDALETVAGKTGRPAHLLEKDVWVVWILSALYDSPLGASLTFKGGTSLSKAYRAIDRFSEDVDLTYDIRTLLADLVDTPLAQPQTRSQAKKWTDTVRQRLPGWIADSVAPLIKDALHRDNLSATLTAQDETLLVSYAPLKQGSGYVTPRITLEFGARSTGEPRGKIPIICDMAPHISGVIFPQAEPYVMALGRTFWEKATAAHVFCAQARMRGERYARHWSDLVALMHHEQFNRIIADREVAQAVATHKSRFFPEKDLHGQIVNYSDAVSGHLKIVPIDDAYEALAQDYQGMIADRLFFSTNVLSFSELMAACAELETAANQAAHTSPLVSPGP